ncbi:MAG: FAD-dependent oxidoreductase [Eubacteriales bacterium]|jgi:hypothetical protein|nr:FAD-dependent oxidoreductase [Eubacteriales bacterium]
MNSSEYDIIVAGGGLAGAAAAISAARENAKVLLIEKHGFLGGMATAGLVNPFMPYVIWKASWTYDWSQVVNQGLFGEILKELKSMGGLHSNNETFNEEFLKLILDRMMKKYNVKVLLHSFVSDVSRKDNKIESITITNKSGNRVFKASYFIDATGDADVSALAGCDFKLGRDGDNFCQPMTLCFRLANVNRDLYDREKSVPMINKIYKSFKEKGLIKNPKENVLLFEHVVDNIVHFNSTRVVGKSAVDAQQLTEAEMEAREQVYELYRFMKENIPGFENCQLLMSAPQIGVRESRRIVGEYIITQEDLLNAVKFEDSIARGTYPLDIHNPAGTGTYIQDIPYGDYYTIPYRALVPKGIDNLIVAGRPISSTHEAHSAYRIMPICTSIGEGAGAAAAIVSKEGGAFKDLSYKKIHAVMDKYNALY